MTVGRPWRLTGGLRVALPPGQAFVLFTARGEQRWVVGWEPRFPGPVADDTEPGVVWETGDTIWVVLHRDPGRRISYARVTPGDRAGTVTVSLAEAPDGGSDVTVTYVLTALTDAADAALAEFAAGYDEFLASWSAAIATHLGS